MAAPIFKFKNVRVPITTTNDTLVYAVDIGLGSRGLDLGVLPEEVSSVVLTVQCANNWSYVPDKTILSVANTNDLFTVADASDLKVGMQVSFRGLAYANVTLAAQGGNGKVYYIKEIIGNTFKVSETLGGSVFAITSDGDNVSAGGYMYMDVDSSVSVTAKIRDLNLNTSVNLVSDYSVLPNNAFDPLNGNLVLTSKLALIIQADVPNAIDVTVSLLEIANATAT
jgi:hypothetical protein